jgi:hypothetical protein
MSPWTSGSLTRLAVPSDREPHPAASTASTRIPPPRTTPTVLGRLRADSTFFIFPPRPFRPTICTGPTIHGTVGRYGAPLGSRSRCCQRPSNQSRESLQPSRSTGARRSLPNSHLTRQSLTTRASRSPRRIDSSRLSIRPSAHKDSNAAEKSRGSARYRSTSSWS